MKSDIEKSITAQRFAQLLASYGADPDHWPNTERDAALDFLAQDVRARRMINEAMQLDQWLQSAGSQQPVFAGLEAKLLRRALPPKAHSLTDRLLTWLLPSPDLPLRQMWRPVAAACLPLVIGVLVGFQVELAPEVYATSVEEELYLISLSDYAEIL